MNWIPAELLKILKDDDIKVLHSICQHFGILENQFAVLFWMQCPQDWERSVFIPIPKKGNAKECSNYHIIVLMLARLILKSFQLSFSSMWTENFQMGFKEAEAPEITSLTFVGLWRKQEISRKKHLLLLIDYAKAFDCMDHNKFWKILKELWVPDNITCLLGNLYAVQEAAVRTWNNGLVQN